MLRMHSYRTLFSAIVLGLAACSTEGTDPLGQNAAAVSDEGVNLPLVNVFDTVVATAGFTYLVEALETTGLDATLADESKTFTLFAATDTAFEKLEGDTVNNWLANPDDYRDLLQYHVVADTAISSVEAVAIVGSMLEMANGDEVAVTHNSKNFFINSSEVIVTDVIAKNGIIHVIDTVMIPPKEEPSPMNIVESMAAAGTFTVFNRAIAATGLVQTLSNTNDKFTVFAPTDEAFAKLPDGSLDALLADPDTLNNLLLYHVIGGAAEQSTSIMSLDGRQKTMANGDDISIYLIDGTLKINDATVTTTDLIASNGVVHALDSMLTPPAHSIDSPDHYAAAAGSILDIVQRTADFSMLAEAIKVAGLEGALGCPIDVYTIFAPTNEAFKSLSEHTRTRLFSDQVAMQELVLLHLLPGRILDAEAASERVGYNLEAGNDEILIMTQQAHSLWVNDAKLLRTDITTLNGIMHVIDKVLIPK